jgi:hypothetical protein
LYPKPHHFVLHQIGRIFCDLIPQDVVLFNRRDLKTCKM